MNRAVAAARVALVDEALSIRSRSTHSVRCAVCHDAARPLKQCPRCNSLFHDVCRRSLGKCPTLACPATIPAEEKTGAFKPTRLDCFSGPVAVTASIASALVTLGVFFFVLAGSTPHSTPGLRLTAAAVLFGFLHAIVLPVVLVRHARPTVSPRLATMYAVTTVLFVASATAFACVLLTDAGLHGLAGTLGVFTWCSGPALAATLANKLIGRDD